MRAYLKTNKMVATNYVDAETGEVVGVDVKKETILVSTKEQFFITYARMVGMYKELSGVQIKMLSWLIINQTAYNSNRVTITGEIKKIISREMSISLSAVNNAILPLVKKNILIREGGPRSATYIINPEYYWKGDLKERNKSLKFVLEILYEGDK